MSKFLSTKYSTSAFNFGMLVLRFMTGVLLMSHGYTKLVGFSEMQNTFYNFMGLGSTVSLVLIIFAEFFCSIFLILGLFTRFACIPIIVAMGVAVFSVSHGHIFSTGEKGTLFLTMAITILLCGPGRISVDGMIGK
ncbi:MAG: DoxX family protein [Ginsengibacter sp.]